MCERRVGGKIKRKEYQIGIIARIRIVKEENEQRDRIDHKRYAREVEFEVACGEGSEHEIIALHE